MADNKAYISSTQVASSVPFDNSTGKGYSSTDVQGALEELRDHTVYDSQTTATTAAGTLTLTSSNTNLQFLTGSAAGYTVQLPSATTIPASSLYQIINTTAQTMSVQDGSAGALFTLGQNSIAYCYLQTAGTTAGVWIYWQVLAASISAGIVNYHMTSSTTFTTTSNTEVLITSFTVTPQAGTYAIWNSMSMQSTASGSTLSGAIYKTGVQIADSERTSHVAAANAPIVFSTNTVGSFSGTDTCDVRVSTTSATMTVTNRSLLMIRLGP